MSRIKDLVITKNVWDIMMEHLKEIKEDISRDAEYGAGVDDDGHTEIYLENFLALCEENAGYYIEQYDDQLGDEQYKEVLEYLTHNLADTLADYESELCEEVLNEAKELEWTSSH